ncbi:heterokaryon incompatibility protein-domain-containing protein [Apiospora sp. TS-2023a]
MVRLLLFGLIITRVLNIKKVPGDEEDEVAMWLQLKSQSAPEPLSPKSISWMKQQLHSCHQGIDDHDQTCASYDRFHFLPTRLIDVRNGNLRIVEGEFLKHQTSAGINLPKYASLSYCWGNISGDGHNYHTTTSNLVARQADIDICCLPSVLQDAVAMTRALSLPYLWVDALCISQDQLGDWETESSQQNMIYSSAYVTIACLTSSCHLGFLEPKNPQVRMKFQSRVDSSILGGYNIEFAHCDRDRVSRRCNVVKSKSIYPPSRWFSRGWTYQEQWLSSRVLLLGLGFMGLSCAIGLSLEGEQGCYRGLPTIRVLASNTGDYDMGKHWADTVSFYVKRHLTVPEDRLPALSGIADAFSHYMGDGYLAGVWKSDIIRGVLWYKTITQHAEVIGLGSFWNH